VEIFGPIDFELKFFYIQFENIGKKFEEKYT